jgi:hypothetical protein
MVKPLRIHPGSVILGPMPNVDHKKFYVIAGVSHNKICICSVIINSKINQFILKRPHLLQRQIELPSEKYSFLSHTSYINCAQPLKSNILYFEEGLFKLVGILDALDTKSVQTEIINSGMLTAEEIALFFDSER